MLTIPLAFIIGWFISLPTLIQEISNVQEANDAVTAAKNPAYIQNTTEEFDYIVVGAGSAGAVLANRLSKDGHFQILIIQDGGDPNPLVDVPGLAEQVKHQPSIDYNYKTVPQTNACLANDGQACILSRGKGLGGSSNVYHMSVVRGNARDYDQWSALLNDPLWSYRNVLNIFKRQEDYFGFYQPPDAQHGRGGNSFVSPQQPSLFPEYFYNASKELGLPLVDTNSNESVGYSHLDLNVKHGIRWGSYHAFLKPILEQQNVRIYRYAKATKISFSESMRATGLTYVRHGVTRTVKARKEILLCAGSIDSPKLLMLSGIGPKRALKSLGITPLLDLPVGQNLQDHVGVNVEFQVNKTGIAFIPERDLTPQVAVSYLSSGRGPLASPFFNPRTLAYMSTTECNDTNWPDIEILARGESANTMLPNGKFLDKVVFQAFLVRPLSHGELTLSSKDPNDPPLINPKYFSHASDMRRLLEGVEFILNLTQTSKVFQSINMTLFPNTNIEGCGDQTFRSKEYWECFISQMTTTLCHPVGTVKMGVKGDPTAVVDSKLRVLGTKGLRVVDTSIMPVIPAGHTHTPAMMIGELGAQIILGSES